MMRKGAGAVHGAIAYYRLAQQDSCGGGSCVVVLQ